MKKVAIFGNTAGGKSTLARRLAALTGLPVYSLDLIQYQPGGREVPSDDFARTHEELLQREAWIIEGYGSRETAWQRFAAADTLVYIDLPLFRHFLWVTKRLLQGIARPPEGWPERSPLLLSSLKSVRVLWLCHRHLTPKYRELVATAAPHQRVHHLRSAAEIDGFLNAMKCACRARSGDPVIACAESPHRQR